MTTVSELVDDIAGTTGIARAIINTYARALINDGLLPKSSGRAIAHVEPVHVIRLFLAAALLPKTGDAAAMVWLYEGMTPAGVPQSSPAYMHNKLGNALVKIFRDSRSEDKWLRAMGRETNIEIVKSWPEAAILYHDPEHSNKPSLSRFKVRDASHATWGGYVKTSTTISGRAFSFLGMGNGRLAGDAYTEPQPQETGS